MGLHAMEIQMVRGNAVDELTTFPELKFVAESLDVAVSTHTPYYIDLLGSEYMVNKSMEMINYAGYVGNQIGAAHVVTHCGPYGGNTPRESMEILVPRLRELRDNYIMNHAIPRIALETAGRKDVFGSLREIVEVCSRVHNIVPVLNWAHMHARGNRWFTQRENFKKVLDFVENHLGLKHFYTHFSGVAYYKSGQERHYTPIKRGDMKFEHLAEVVLENDYSITFISDSPLLEHDAMYMKVILERVEVRRQEKLARVRAAQQMKETRRVSIS